MASMIPRINNKIDVINEEIMNTFDEIEDD